MTIQPLRDSSFIVAGNTGGTEAVLEALAKYYQVEETEAGAEKELFFDTFDWRLFRNKKILISSRGKLVLKDFKGKELSRLLSKRTGRFFWWDLLDSELKAILKKHASVRALAPTITLSFSFRTFRIMNSDRKTVLRLSCRQNTAEADGAAIELPEIISLQEIRGYEKPYAKALELMPPSVRPLERYVEIVDEAYGVSERQPLDYGAKFDIDLAEHISVGEAASKIFLNLIDSMEVNRPGLIADIDSEFLHDFRIAVRRTRSLISLLRKLLPQEQIRPFEEEFRWLGSVTGPMRDIDVYLLKEEDYKKQVPKSLRNGLDLFFSNLGADRERNLATLRQVLSSDRYETLVKSWQRFLVAPDSELRQGIMTQRLKPIVSRIISKRFKSFIKDGDLITDATPDKSLHQLRIKGKKFRYLLEFFRAFYNREEVELFLKHMKKLQDNLGDFNDLSVQMHMLEKVLSGLKARNKQTVMLAAALGSLISSLKKAHKEIRSEFKQTYDSFRVPENKETGQDYDFVPKAAKRRSREEDMRTIAVYSSKGGVGKTATAVNLSYSALQSGNRVLVCDMDSQGAASFYYRIKPKKSFNRSKLLKGDFLSYIRGTDYDGLDLLPAHFSFRNLDIALKKNDRESNRKILTELLGRLDGEYDYVFLDCPPNLTLLSENIIIAADCVVSPVVPTTLSVIALNQLYKLFKKVGCGKSKILPFFFNG